MNFISLAIRLFFLFAFRIVKAISNNDGKTNDKFQSTAYAFKCFIWKKIIVISLTGKGIVWKWQRWPFRRKLQKQTTISDTHQQKLCLSKKAKHTDNKAEKKVCFICHCCFFYIKKYLLSRLDCFMCRRHQLTIHSSMNDNGTG